MGEAGARPALSRNCNGARVTRARLPASIVAQITFAERVYGIMKLHARRSGAPGRVLCNVAARGVPSPICRRNVGRQYGTQMQAARLNRYWRLPRISLAGRRALYPLLTLLAILVVARYMTSVVRADGQHDQAIRAAVPYLRTQVTAEGGLDAFGSGADPSTTARAVLALATLGLDQDMLAHPETGATPLAYLQHTALDYTHEPGFVDADHLFPGNAGLVIAALAAAGVAPATTGDIDLVAQLEQTITATGAYSTTARAGFTTGEALAPNQAWSILGLAMTGRAIPPEAIDYLKGLQSADGSWLESDPDTTGLAVVALMSTGQVSVSDPTVARALGFFRATQLPNGGWRPGWDTEPLNVDSTAWAIQALLSCGYTFPLTTWQQTTPPEDSLAAAQQADGRIGGVYASAYSTAEALFGLAETPLFLTPALRIERGLTWIAGQSAEPGVSPGTLIDAALAFLSAGYDPATVAAGSGSLMDRISAVAEEYAAGSVDQAGKLALLQGAAGMEPIVPGLDLAAALYSEYDPEIGAFGVITNTYHQAYGLLGLAALREEIPEEAHVGLVALQQPDGGYKYDLTDAEWNTTTPDNTGLAIQALLAAGLTAEHTAVQDALSYLRASQDTAGGWGNANATALAIQALLASGQDLEAWTTTGGASPYLALAGYGKMDGAFVWMWESPFGTPEDNLLATAQAIPALAEKSLTQSFTQPQPFVPVPLGPDPDRLIVGDSRVYAGDDGAIIVDLAFSGDLDRDASVLADWIAPGQQAWSTVDVVATAGIFSIILPGDTASPSLVRWRLSDPDGVSAFDSSGSLAILGVRVPPSRWLGSFVAPGIQMPYALDFWLP